MDIKSLPNYVLYDIFRRLCSHALHDQHSHTERPMVDILASVCACWRGLVLDSTALWTCVVINSHRSLECTRRWLSNSRDAPLTVTYVLPFETYHWESRGFVDHTILLQKHFYRVSHCSIICPGKEGEVISVPARQICHQVLEPLSLCSALRSLSVAGISNTPYRLTSSDTFPSLQELTLPYGSLPSWPFANLKVLKVIHQDHDADWQSLSGRTWPELRRLLLASPDLEELELGHPNAYYLPSDTYLLPDSDNPIVFNRLRVLRITRCWGPLLADFRRVVKMPHLLSLSISVYESDERSHRTILFDVLPTLKHLEIDVQYGRGTNPGGEFLNTSIFSVLAASPPVLEHLSIQMSATHWLFSAEKSKLHDKTILALNRCRKLKDLVLRDVHPGNGDVFVEMATRRVEEGCVPLESVVGLTEELLAGVASSLKNINVAFASYE